MRREEGWCRVEVDGHLLILPLRNSYSSLTASTERTGLDMCRVRPWKSTSWLNEPRTSDVLVLCLVLFFPIFHWQFRPPSVLHFSLIPSCVQFPAPVPHIYALALTFLPSVTLSPGPGVAHSVGDWADKQTFWILTDLPQEIQLDSGGIALLGIGPSPGTRFSTREWVISAASSKLFSTAILLKHNKNKRIIWEEHWNKGKRVQFIVNRNFCRLMFASSVQPPVLWSPPWVGASSVSVHSGARPSANSRDNVHICFLQLRRADAQSSAWPGPKVPQCWTNKCPPKGP